MSHPLENSDHSPSTACKIKGLARDINAAVNRLLAPYEVGFSQAEFLACLLYGLNSPSSIAEFMDTDASNLSRMIRQFEKRGWVTRAVNEQNRTRVELQLTNAGRAIALKIDPHAAIIQYTLLNGFTSEESIELNRLLTKASKSLAQGPIREMNNSTEPE